MEADVIFKKGTAYAIINKAMDMALKPQEMDPKKYEQSRIICTKYNPLDDTQMFFIQKVGKNVDDYEIVNLRTSQVFTEDGKEIKLYVGKQKSSQLFAITKATSAFFTYYWIRTSEKGDKAIYLEGSLKYGPFDPNNQSQMFRFEEVKTNPTINTSSIIVNKISGKALDIPGGTFEPGERIIQYEVNKRFNQRWTFVKHDKGYLIQSVLNGLFLDIAGESRSSGAKVVQWSKTGNPNQQWLPEPLGNGVYKLRSIHEATMYLGIKHDSLEDGGKLQATKQPNSSIVWIIYGALP